MIEKSFYFTHNQKLPKLNNKFQLLYSNSFVNQNDVNELGQGRETIVLRVSAFAIFKTL